MNRVARFRLGPRDMCSDADYYDVVGDNDGIFGYMSLLACHDVCAMNCRCRRRLRTCTARSMKRGFGKAVLPRTRAFPSSRRARRPLRRPAGTATAPGR